MIPPRAATSPQVSQVHATDVMRPFSAVSRLKARRKQIGQSSGVPLAVHTMVAVSMSTTLPHAPRASKPLGG